MDGSGMTFKIVPKIMKKTLSINNSNVRIVPEVYLSVLLTSQLLYPLFLYFAQL